MQVSYATGLGESPPAVTPAGSLWEVLSGALNVYQNIETQKLQQRIQQSQLKQDRALFAIERQSNIDASMGASSVASSLTFDPKIFLWVMGLGLVAVGVYAAVAR